LVAIGPTTAEKLKGINWKVAGVAKVPNPSSLLEACLSIE